MATLGGVGRNPHCPGLDRVGGWGGDDGKGEGVRGGGGRDEVAGA